MDNTYMGDLKDIIQRNIKSLDERDAALKLLGVLQQSYEKYINLTAKYETLSEENEFFKAALNALSNPIFIKDGYSKFVFFNRKYNEYFNVKGDKYYDKTVLDLDYLPPEDRQRYQKEDVELIKTGGTKKYETSFDNSDGTKKYVLHYSSAFNTGDSNTRGLIGEIVDITLEKKLKEEIQKDVLNLAQANEKIEGLLKQDYLTGVYNRRIIEDFIEYHNKEKGQIKASVLLADLDYFKTVNDTYGHLIGDEILVNFSNILRSLCRKDDFIIRYGGEEFVVVFFNTDLKNALSVAERIRKTTAEKLILPDKKNVTVSIGLSQLNSNESMEQCMHRVDTALYEAKQNGRNTIVVK